MQRNVLILVLFATLVLFGCSAPKPEQLQPLVEQTIAAIPTQTSLPTYTPYPTYTKVPTQTPKVIVVTPTNTRTPTLTPTPIQSPTSTQPPTNTLQPWQLTQQAANATAQVLAEYEVVNSKDFLTYPDKYDGKKVKVSCRIFNVVGNGEIQCYILGTYDAFYVRMKSSFDDLYEKDYLTIYGKGAGSHCFTNVMGNQTCQPLITGAFYTKP